MADSSAVWGIDIGQAGLKAIRLRYAEASQQVMALAFDYVPHAKILSQPDAVPHELIAESLKTFFARNETKNDRIAISVPGQNSLTRFIQLPPVQVAKIADIVKYEAKQQIPFDLEEVVWDYQPIGSGIEEGGFLLDAEVGLFAMKRDLLMQQLQPFNDAKAEVDLIQIAPLTLYNYLSYDQLGVRNDAGPANPEDYTILLDMGADNTTLLVSNGLKIWIRNIPIGGNNFTRALTKDMKLTFAKAEHLKCNATKAPDPKAVFQALRPVFNDFVSEVQRSIGYFSSVNRGAKIQRILGAGNGFKLAGLQKFLHQSLQYPVERVETFIGMIGTNVTESPLFQENIMAFVVPYGLALQALGQTKIKTTLLPQEIQTARLIRKKKPWAVAAAAALLLGAIMSTTAQALVTSTVDDSKWKAAKDAAAAIASKTSTSEAAYATALTGFTAKQTLGLKLVKSVEGRDYWAELFKAIDTCIPAPSLEEVESGMIEKQQKMSIHAVLSRRVDNLEKWFQGIPGGSKNDMLESQMLAPPKGEGYVISLRGVHYYKDNPKGEKNFIANTLIKNLNEWTITTTTSTGQQIEIPIRKLGISHPVMIKKEEEIMYSPVLPQGMPGQPGTVIAHAPQMTEEEKARAALEANDPTKQKEEKVDPLGQRRITRTQFVVQFVFKETPVVDRAEQPPPEPPKGTAKPFADTKPVGGVARPAAPPAVPFPGAQVPPGVDPAEVGAPMPPPTAPPASATPD